MILIKIHNITKSRRHQPTGGDVTHLEVGRKREYRWQSARPKSNSLTGAVDAAFLEVLTAEPRRPFGDPQFAIVITFDIEAPLFPLDRVLGKSGGEEPRR